MQATPSSKISVVFMTSSKGKVLDTLYRESTLGVCLSESTRELKEQGKLTEKLEAKILLEFDKAIIEALSEHTSVHGLLKGRKYAHNLCDDIYRIDVKDAELNLIGPLGAKTLTAESLRIIAVPSSAKEKASRGRKK